MGDRSHHPIPKRQGRANLTSMHAFFSPVPGKIIAVHCELPHERRAFWEGVVPEFPAGSVAALQVAQTCMCHSNHERPTYLSLVLMTVQGRPRRADAKKSVKNYQGPTIYKENAIRKYLLNFNGIMT